MSADLEALNAIKADIDELVNRVYAADLGVPATVKMNFALAVTEAWGKTLGQSHPQTAIVEGARRETVADLDSYVRGSAA